MYKNIFKLKRVVGIIIVITFALFFSTAAICTADDGILQVTIEKSAQNPIAGTPVYLFNESGSYLGQSQTTNSNGEVEFDLSEGTYKIRVDYLGYQFWSPVYTISGNLAETFTISHQDVTLTIQGDYPSIEPITNIPVYLFTEGGVYVSQNQTTDTNGQVVFNLPEQSYKVRADYMGQQFWSDPFTWQDTTVTVPMADAEITVTSAGAPVEGVNVYVFTASGSYVSLNNATSSEGKVTFNIPAGDYKFRADYQGSQYWSDPATLTPGQVNPVEISTGGGTLAFTVLKGADVPLSYVNCYVFTEAGTYISMSDATDANGLVSFNLAEGTYKIRVDYLGYKFWSPVYTVSGNLAETFTISHQDVTLTIQGDYPSIEPITNIPVYLFTEGGAYVSQNQTTDTNGQVVFNLPEQSYKVRADYMGQQFWSDPFTWQDTTVTVPMADAEITVTSAGAPVEGVNVYVFTASGSYISLNGATNSEGKVTFNIPAGDYKFRADYQGSQYWSDFATLTPGQVNPVDILTGGGGFSFTVLKGPGVPLADVNCYVFSESGSYLSMSDATDASGLVSFNLADGTYKIRVDYLGYKFWSPVYTVTGNLAETFTISHQDVTLTVQGDYPSTEPISGIPVYLFTEGGAYVSQNQTTDDNGQVVFNLPEESFKVRADYLGQHFWSDPFTWQDTTVTVPMADAEITVTSAGAPVEGVNVYVFTASGSYVSLNNATSSEGKVTFNIPAGDYKFRADYQGSQYWSDPATLTPGQVNPVDILTGGGGFSFTVLKGPGVPLSDVNCYVFSESGSYLSMSDATDASGLVSFNLAEGTYKIRVDYLGYKFWSPVYTVTGNLAETFTIAHQDVTLTVQGDYPSTEPISGIPVYLFTEGGSYVSQNQTTDDNGQVVFNLPEESFKVRADYLGQHFWSDPFTWQDTAVTINQGMAAVHVIRSGSNVADAEVYLFSEAGAYLGRHQTTDESGKAEFLLSNTSFKFRIDEGGNQYWSPVVTIQAGTVNNIEVDISPITVNISADPESIQPGESSTLTWDSTGADACVIEPDIGTVDVNGSTQVSPDTTTTYTITATGSAGTATDSITITVNAPPSFSETKLTASDASGFASFGSSVSIYGDTAIVGAPYAVNDGIESGVAYIFKNNGSAWVEEARLVASDGEEWDEFGWSVSIYGDTAVVGADCAYSQGYITGAVYVFQREGSTWTQQAKLIPSDPIEWAFFGNSVSMYGDYVIVGAEGDSNVEVTSGTAYIFKREGTTWTRQAKLAPSNGNFEGYFGHSVSIYKDYAIVGGGNNLNDTEDENCAAYIFKRDGTSWTEQAKLLVQGLSDWGSSVSIYKDYAIVGTTYGVHDGIYQGAAFIFKRDGSVWDQQAKLTASDPMEDDYFGSSVAIYEDYAVVGAYGNQENGSYIGAAYIFKKEDSVWSEQAKLTAGDADQWPIYSDLWYYCSGYGRAVALDGGNTIIGADLAATGGIESGAAYIYSIPTIGVELIADPDNIILGESSTLSWSSDQASSCVIEPGIGPVDVSGSITVSPTETTTYTISATGTVGISTDSVIVNVVNSSVPPTVNIDIAPTTIQSGRAAILSWSSTNASSAIIDQGIGNVDPNGSLEVSPTETTTYTITVTGPAGTATKSVTVVVTPPMPTTSISASVNSILPGESYTLTWNSSHADSCIIEPGIGIVDLNGTIRVSSETTKSYTITATGPGGTATAAVTITVNPPSSDEFENKLQAFGYGDYFGSSVSISGDTAIVGDTCEYNCDTSSGSAYIFEHEFGNWTKYTKVWGSDSAPRDRFGWSVSIDGNTAIVGAPYDDDDGTYSGSAYILTYNGFSWIEQAKLTARDASEYENFGFSVGISGDTVIVGAPGADEGTGAVYFFKRVGTSWTQILGKFKADDAVPGDYFGYSVSIDDNFAIVGAWGNDDAGSNSGAAYIFFGTEGIWHQVTKLTASDATEYADFGRSVGISGDNAIVNGNGVYIFNFNGVTWNEQTKLTPDDGSGTSAFGTSVSIDGDYAIVGDDYDSEVESHSGAAYIFKRDGLSWSLMKKIKASDASREDYFGTLVSIGGGNAIVRNGADNNRSVYIYKLFPPTLDIYASPSIIQTGASSTLHWSTENAENVSIDQGIGSVSAEGSLSVSPQQTTTYTITATGSDGTSTDKVTVYVLDPSLPPTVSISATPDILTLGEPFTLTWSSTNANYCEIQPGIGSVDLSGSMEITPGATKTYTIIAFGPAGTAIETLTVIVSSPTVPPTVEISPNPETIIFGKSSSLTWNSTNAYSCVIEPDIGRVDLNGYVNISPTETTTYTITATGYAGTTTSNATVTVIPLPTVNLIASPLSIDVGESVTLTWDSANADSCVIEPDIGSVDLSGSLSVSPTETTTYTITATGPGGEDSESVTIDVAPPVTLQITSPAHLQTIDRPDIMVEGTLSNYLGNETGVTVNGQVAMVFNDRFVANHVPLEEGENTITVIGTDSQGFTATTEITVYAYVSGDYITVTADTESGVSPFETTLQVDGTFTFEQEPVITPSGPDTVDPLESLGDAQYRIGMTTPGIYYFTSEAIDDQSNIYTDIIAVVVLEQAQLDSLLRAKWDAMKTALINGNIEQAAGYFSISSRAVFQQQFTALSSVLPQIVGDMGEINLIDVRKKRIVYDLRTIRNNETYSFQLLFIQDEDGIWRIRNF